MSECTTPNPLARKGFFEPGERVRVLLRIDAQKCDWFEGEIARLDAHTGEPIILNGDLILVYFPGGAKCTPTRTVYSIAVNVASEPEKIEHLWETPAERAAWRAS